MMILKVGTQKLLFCRGDFAGETLIGLKTQLARCFQKHLPFDAVVLSSPQSPNHHPPPPLSSQSKKTFRSFSQRLRTAAARPSKGLCQILCESLTGSSENAFIPRTSFSWLEDDWWASQRPIRRGGGGGLAVAGAGSYCHRVAHKTLGIFKAAGLTCLVFFFSSLAFDLFVFLHIQKINS